MKYLSLEENTLKCLNLKQDILAIRVKNNETCNLNRIHWQFIIKCNEMFKSRTGYTGNSLSSAMKLISRTGYTGNFLTSAMKHLSLEQGTLATRYQVQ